MYFPLALIQPSYGRELNGCCCVVDDDNSKERHDKHNFWYLYFVFVFHNHNKHNYLSFQEHDDHLQKIEYIWVLLPLGCLYNQKPRNILQPE